MTSEPACIAQADERFAAAMRDQAAGLLIGGRRIVEHGLSGVEAGLFLMERAADQGGSVADIAASATALERQAAALVARLVKLRVESTASATPNQRAA
ncbi:MAG: hypothetical protein WAP03_21750 [Methylorubrum rhodinum]|uniref:hypothetical protein n=1 Tax=Methylorubrum rhodinum TaxID=29428 RepID=UPI003BB174D1